MATAKEKFFEECGYSDNYYGNDMTDLASDLPCYGMRISVKNAVNTPDRIKRLIRYGKQAATEGGEGENMLIFSVTKEDDCWQAWVDYAKANPTTFAAVVQTTSRHRGHYPVRMYVVVKKPRKKA